MAYAPRNPQAIVSTNNSTTANLAGAAAFTGTADDVLNFSSVVVNVFSSHVSATNGLSVQWSSNGTNWDIVDTYTISAANGVTFSFQPVARYMRLVYTNGATLTTSLRIQTVLRDVMDKVSSVRPQDAQSNEMDTEQVSAFGFVWNGTTWDRAPGNTTGAFGQGPVADDAVLTGNPVRVGARAHSGVPTAMSADNDIVTLWTDRSGAQVVIPQPRQVDLQGVPTLSITPDYTALDQFGTVITFTSAALATGRPFQIVAANLLDRAVQSVKLTLLLFRASPTLASSDNAAFSITAANASTARFMGSIVFNAADYVSGTSCSFCPGQLIQGSIAGVTSGSANIFGIMIAGGTFNAAATGDVEVNLIINQF
jgi:hypothetical protein